MGDAFHDLILQYLEDILPNWGGFSQSMDYAPIRYGIWNCQDQEPSLEDIAQQEDVDFIDAGELFSNTQSEISKFGGQVC